MTEQGMRWRRLTAQSRWLWGLSVLLVVLGVALEAWSAPGTWLSFLLAAVAAVGGSIHAWLGGRAAARDDRAGRVLRAARTGDERGGLQRVRDLADREFGVHPAHVEVPYVRRDKEGHLQDVLNAGRPALVVGHSMAGKTRMAAEVVRRLYPDYPIFVPVPPDGLAQLAPDALPANAVVWLNDLERYLTGDGLRVEWLDRMLRQDNIIVATIRAKEHEKLQPTRDVRPPLTEVVERFEAIRLHSDDSGEQDRIAAQIRDPDVRSGVQKYGLAEYVGAGYLAVHRFETGVSEHPLGAAMVRAAVDWRRVGLDAIAPTSLAALAPMYLPERFRLDPGEDTATALSWASERIDATMRLLEPAGDAGYRAFDYILDYLSRKAAEIPEQTWREATAAAPADRALLVGTTAYTLDNHDRAAVLWQRVLENKDSDEAQVSAAAFGLGVLAKENNDLEGAVEAFKQAVASDHSDMAPAAAYHLGRLLREQGDVDGAVEAFKQAVASDHSDMAPAAAYHLGRLLREQ